MPGVGGGLDKWGKAVVGGETKNGKCVDVRVIVVTVVILMVAMMMICKFESESEWEL